MEARESQSRVDAGQHGSMARGPDGGHPNWCGGGEGTAGSRRVVVAEPQGALALVVWRRYRHGPGGSAMTVMLVGQLEGAYWWW